MTTSDVRSPSKRENAAAGIALYQMAIGHYLSRALNLAAKLGLADLMKDGPRNYHELAAASETHAPSLSRVLRLLTSVGIFEEFDRDRFGLTPLGTLLRSGVPGSMCALVMLFAGTGLQDSWKELEYCVRTGEPGISTDQSGCGSLQSTGTGSGTSRDLRRGDGHLRTYNGCRGCRGV